MQQQTKHTLRAFILSFLLASTGIVSAATVSTTQNTPQTSDAVVATTQSSDTKAAVHQQNVQDTAASVATPSASTTREQAAVTALGDAPAAVPAVESTPYVATHSNIQDVRPYIFSDVPSDFWAARSISAVTQSKLMKGYSDGTFRPNQPMTREEVASLFNNITDDGQAAFLSSRFKDITSDRWSALAIDSVARKNIISGYGDETYKPEKFMSRQEFAVVADNYLHYLGYTTEDPTALDHVAYSDQKFVAPWAQDAVREMAYLGFTNYSPTTLFNPEKYITRAEAAEITYRMTQTEQALDFHNTLNRQQVDKKATKIITHTLGYGDDITQFRNDGAMFWKGGKLMVTATDKKNVEKLTTAFEHSSDPLLTNTVIVSKGKLNQAQLEDYESDALPLYKEQEPQGQIISVLPNDDASALVIIADSVQDSTVKAFKKKFGKKVVLELPQNINPGAQIQFPLPLKPTK